MGRENTDRTWSNYQNTIAWPYVSIMHHSVIGDTARFGQGGMFAGHTVWKVVQDALRHGNEVTHGPINQSTVAFAGRIKVV